MHVSDERGGTATAVVYEIESREHVRPEDPRLRDETGFPTVICAARRALKKKSVAEIHGPV
jgi:hypothetical protein